MEEFFSYVVHQTDAVSEKIIGEKGIGDKGVMKKKDKQDVFPGEISGLRILSYNIWCGFDYGGNSKGKDEEREKRCIDFIRSLSPNVVALQELNGFTQEKLGKMGRAWGHHYAVLLKEEGYPVGITSDKPIILQAKIIDPLWHGLLHVKTWGIDFFVFHLSPGFDRRYCCNEAEFIMTYMTQKLGTQDRYVVLGDFNAPSPFDVGFYQEQNRNWKQYAQKFADTGFTSLPIRDFTTISRFLNFPTIDVCERFVDPKSRYTYPTIIYAPERPKEESLAFACRIDYILASPLLADRCVGAAIIHSRETESLSDHYPVTADFVFTEQLFPTQASMNEMTGKDMPAAPFQTDGLE